MANHQKQHKQHERFLLERFLEAAGLQAEIIEERESPDFIVQFEGRLIGVEVTKLFKSHGKSRNLLQAQESISTRIVFRAQQQYQASGARPAHVTVCFAPRCDLRDLNRDRTAAALASFVSSLNLSEGQSADWQHEELNGPLPYGISCIHARGVPSIDMAHWGVARAGWAAALTADALLARIQEKSTRLPRYRDTIPENWLVIVADGRKPSQLFDSVPRLDVSAISSPFSRSFFYGHPERVVIELGG